MAHLELPIGPVGLENNIMRRLKDPVSSEITRLAFITVIVGLIIIWSSLILGIGWPIRILVAGVSSLNLARRTTLGNMRRARDIMLTGDR